MYLWDMLDARGNGQVRNDQKTQDQKSTYPHRPREADFGNQTLDHDGENDASERGTGCCDAECKGSLLEKPCRQTAHGRVEDHTGSRRAADTLGEHELVVLRCQTGHQEAKDVEKGSGEEDPARTVVVKSLADEWAHEEHHERFQRWDPGYGA